MALIALFTQMARSTNRSTPLTAITGCQLPNVTAAVGPARAAPVGKSRPRSGNVHECRKENPRGRRQVGKLLLSHAIHLPPVHASDAELGADLIPAHPLTRRRPIISVGVDES